MVPGERWCESLDEATLPHLFSRPSGAPLHSRRGSGWFPDSRPSHMLGLESLSSCELQVQSGEVQQCIDESHWDDASTKEKKQPQHMQMN
jgi:hypothetical protein